MRKEKRKENDGEKTEWKQERGKKVKQEVISTGDNPDRVTFPPINPLHSHYLERGLCTRSGLLLFEGLVKGNRPD